MDKIVYKVVSSDSERAYVSANKGGIPKEFQLQYFLDRTTRPKIGRIFVFEDFDSASTFFYYYSFPTYILKGMATDIGKPKYRAINGEVNRFWKFKEHKLSLKCRLSIVRVPRGTLTCSSFTPTEIVKSRL